METASLKDRLQTDMKQAMRGGERDRLGVIRFLMAAIKQKEIDDRQKYAETGLPDSEVLAVVEKLCKQRRDSIDAYKAANRDDLVQVETQELEVLLTYLPPQLTTDELKEMIDQVVTETGATSIKEMGSVMTVLKSKIQGRADMKAVSAEIKNRLG